MLGNLPKHVQRQARTAYSLFRENPHHQSLHFKLLDATEQLYSVCIGLSYRALGFLDENNEIVWFWIGKHAEYDKLIDQL